MEDHSTCPHTYMSHGGACRYETTIEEWGPKMDKPSANDYKLVAEFLMYYMGMDTRAKLMNELPGAYNRILGYEVVKVTRTSDNTRIGQ